MPDTPDNESVASAPVLSGEGSPCVTENPPCAAQVSRDQVELPIEERMVAGVVVRRSSPLQATPSVELTNWLRIGQDARKQALAEILCEHLMNKQYPPASVALVALENDVLERPVRAVCSFMPGCVQGEDSLPRFIRGLERRVRTKLGVPIEVLADEQKDRNKLRQLIVVAKSGKERE